MYTNSINLFSRIIINPGCSIGLHTHNDDEEFFYILKGRALFSDNGIGKELLPGDAAKTGGGEVHCIECVGDIALELLAIIVK